MTKQGNGERTRARRLLLTTALAVAVALVAAGCGGRSGSGSGGGQTTTTPTLGPRPSTSAKLSILSPRDGQVVHGTTVDLKLRLQGAKIVAVVSKDLRPDRGHVHVRLDGQLVSMTFGLEQKIPSLKPGTHVLQVEFVATDHLPFDPRVLAQTAFQVRS
ncbi:MAG TPA: hypothetical protein VF995_02230 [Actinomycetota bacterium]